jgi:glucokinase
MQDQCSGQVVLAYDVGGSHIAAAACRKNFFEIDGIVSAPHPADGSPGAFCDAIYSLGMRAAAGVDRVEGASLAVPGPFDYAHGISRLKHKMPYLYGLNLRVELAKRFGWQPSQVRFLNDAAAFLLGEIGAGAARGARRAVGVTLGTGIGASFAVDGRVVTEGDGIPPGGEIWNFPCNGGIVEDSLSSRAVQGSYRRQTGKLLTVAEIAASAAADAVAVQVFLDYGRDLGQALRLTVANFRPEVIVLGGNIVHSADLFVPAAERELSGLGFRLQISSLFERAALAGASVAWFQACTPNPASPG